MPCPPKPRRKTGARRVRLGLPCVCGLAKVGVFLPKVELQVELEVRWTNVCRRAHLLPLELSLHSLVAKKPPCVCFGCCNLIIALLSFFTRVVCYHHADHHEDSSPRDGSLGNP